MSSTSGRGGRNDVLVLGYAAIKVDEGYAADLHLCDTGLASASYNNALAVARNFMYLTPELGEYLRQNALSQVQTAVGEYTYVAPYWFVSRYDNSYGESTLQHLYDSPALFQAKAYVLNQLKDFLMDLADGGMAHEHTQS